MQLIKGFSEIEIKKEIDSFIKKYPIFIDHPLILSNLSKRFVYRGVSIRKWVKDNQPIFDACVEIPK